MKDQLKAFVIMPFDEEFNSIYENLIKEPLTEAGYDVSRADSLLHQQNILHDIVRGIATADLIVADLTANNPNVFYELGLSHALGIPTALIAQSINDVPFDLRSYKIHIYETHFNQIKKLKEFLKRLGEEHKRGQIAFRNPVTDFSQRTLRPEKLPQHAGVKRQAKAVPDEEGQEWLDYVAEGEAAANDLTGILAKLAKDNESITDRIRKHSATMQVLSNNPAAGSARKFHKLTLLAASDINSFSNKVDNLLQPLENVIERLNKSYSGLIEVVELSTEQDKDGIRQLQKSLSDLLQNSKQAKIGIQSFRDAGLGLAERKISKDLSRASRRLAEALNSVISNIDKIEAFCINTLARIEERFGSSLEEVSA